MHSIVGIGVDEDYDKDENIKIADQICVLIKNKNYGGSKEVIGNSGWVWSKYFEYPYRYWNDGNSTVWSEINDGKSFKNRIREEVEKLSKVIDEVMSVPESNSSLAKEKGIDSLTEKDIEKIIHESRGVSNNS